MLEGVFNFNLREQWRRAELEREFMLVHKIIVKRNSDWWGEGE